MVCVNLENVLDESEITQLPEIVKNKISEALLSQSQFIEELKNENTELGAVSERQQFQFEKEIFETQERLKESTDACLELKNQVGKLEETLNSCQKKCRELQSNCDAAELELQSVKKNNDLLCEEKKGIVDHLEKTRSEIEKLNVELKNLMSQVTASNDAKCEAIASAEEAKLKESNLQHLVKRREQEKDLLNKQISDLNAEVSQKNHEIHTLKREKSSNVLDLQLQLDSHIEEVHLLQKQVAGLKKSNEEKDRRVEILAERIRGLNEVQSESEEQFNLEIRAQTKLVDLYKQSNDDAQQRVQELIRGFEELQKVLQETQLSHESLETSKTEMEEQFQIQLESKDSELVKIREELKNANDLLSQNPGMTPERLESLFPTAAATSKVLRSGMTLTQLYSEYIKAQEEVQLQKNENLRLTQQLQQIVGEIQENAPVINQKMQEYHKAVDTISCLRTQLSSSLVDQENLQSERDDAKRIRDQMERENSRLRHQVSDLNQQVQVLLKEVEEARGGHVRLGDRSSGFQEVSSTDEVTANRIISRHLVTFSDIEELQLKNQQLLSVVRELSKQQEEHEKKNVAEELATLQKKFEAASLQLEELKKSRVKQAEMVETIIRQRDMYRVLLTNQGYSESLFGSPGAASGSMVEKTALSPRDSRLQDTRSALKQLQVEFDTYKKEKAENTKMINDQLEKLRDESSDLRVKNAKLSSQLEYGAERLSLLQSNMENSVKEKASLKEKNQKHSNLVAQHQQTVNTLREDIMVVHEKLSKAEVAVDNLKAEKEILKGVEARLLQEKESMMREQQQQSRVLIHLQTVQNNLERIESETQRNLRYQMEKFEKESAMLRIKLQNANEDYRAAVKVWEKETKDLQQKLDKENEKNRKMHDDLVNAYAEVHKLKQEIITLQSRTVSTEAQLEKKTVVEQRQASTQLASSTAECKKLKEQLNENESRFSALKEKWELTQKSSAHYLNTANDLELRVKEQDEINKQLKTEMERTLEKCNTERENIERNMEDMEKTNRQLIEDNMKLSQEKNTKQDELVKKIALLEKELESAIKAKDEAEKVSSQAREDCRNQAKLLQEAEDKYQRELIHHAEDMQQLCNIKEEHEGLKESVIGLQAKVLDAEQVLAAREASWNEQEKLIRNEQKSLMEQKNELLSQNESIHHQLQLMGTQLAAFKGKNWDTDTTVPLPEGEAQPFQHFINIIKYIKQENEILSTKWDAEHSENARLKIKVDQQVLQLSEMKSEFNEQQQNSLAQASSDAQHAELLRKIEMMNLLTDSNKLLRSEKDALQESKIELEQKVQKLEEKVAPLEAKNKDLISQLDVATTEITVLRGEVNSWQSRTQLLLDQSHKIGPQEHKNLMKEMDELKRQKVLLAEELQKKQSESLQLNSSITLLKRTMDTLQNEKVQLTQEMAKKTAEDADIQKTMIQIKKIGRKYRANYDDLKVNYDALKIAHDELAAKAAAPVDFNETEKKFHDMETELKDEINKEKEKYAKAQIEIETYKNLCTEKDDKAKKVLSQVRQNYTQFKAQKADWAKEAAELKARISSLVQSAEEESVRFAALKSQLESKLNAAEKEVNASKETIRELEMQNEELNQKVAQQQNQVSKSAAVSALSDRGSGSSSEPLKANIKPMASPVPVSASGGLRHSAHSHVAVAAPSARSTPTASIRPMAIGTVTSAATPQTRMAAVLPTTVTTVATPIEEDTPSAPPQPSTVPQAAVQPTPAAATATAARTTVAATGTLQSHPPVISEVSPTTATVSSLCEAETTPIPGEPVQSHLISSAGTSVSSPATALVSPRIEGADSSPSEGMSVDTPAPTTSVIVSPPATQVVTPTVKRTREEIETPSPSECADGAVHLQKRVRMISEGSQTNQQLSAQSSSVSNVAVATVVSRKMPVELTVDSQPESRDSQTFAEVHSSASTMKTDNEVASSSRSVEKDAADGTEEKETLERTVEDQEMEDESIVESEEMGDPQPGDGIELIDVGDSNSDNQMEADSSSLQAALADQTMAPPAYPTPSGSPLRPEPSTTSAAAEPMPIQGSPNLTQRPPLLPRVPSRQERLPSTVRQHLAPFTIPGQGPSYEEGDDSIVPSTPTLFVPRRTDGFAEAVSSPHVPQVRFSFLNPEGGSPSQQGLSQLASQGALGVDDTRMDLSQFDEGGGRTVPSTPIQISPPVETGGPEVPEITQLSEQPRSPHIHESVAVPAIKIDAPETASADLSESVEATVESKVPVKESSSVEAGDPENDQEPKESQTVITSISTAEGDTTALSSGQSASADDTKTATKEGVGDSEEISDPQSSGPSQNPSHQRKPIIWKDGNKTSPSPQPTQFPTPSPHPSASAAPRASRSQRGGRRVRFRGPSGYSRAPGMWQSQRRGRGGHRFQ